MIYEKINSYISKHKGMSLSKFEVACGLSNGIVGKWRDGKSNPTMKSLEKIAKATKTSVRSWL